MLKCHIAAIGKKEKSPSVSVSIGEEIRLLFQCGLCDYGLCRVHQPTLNQRVAEHS